MKILIEIVDDLDEEVVVIKCKEITKDIQMIQKHILNQNSSKKQMVFYKNNEEYYFPIEHIIFFETDGDEVFAHTVDDAYKVKYRLYELEKDLPDTFLRISKSTIINVQQVYSIQKNIAASSRVQFRHSHKEVYVSRMYYKALRFKLQERS
ncbi:LytTR family DNA-binding domain-containing protein [Breznakia pachnodae]|uniref:DNA-binding LytR/AlgR family response regulator n=1 Tax=Breznakia pachnodae TaxID=265178 RepID=A0ABU0DY25_9FIRM|nr:LytTR family DNA-binding domain-containing protein [Breznakia pachnodae]MDQ0359538.1 DNA-binding LytR/AlgR family response regulator [Breznakia pachnodae]